MLFPAAARLWGRRTRAVLTGRTRRTVGRCGRRSRGPLSRFRDCAPAQSREAAASSHHALSAVCLDSGIPRRCRRPSTKVPPRVVRSGANCALPSAVKAVGRGVRTVTPQESYALPAHAPAYSGCARSPWFATASLAALPRVYPASHPLAQSAAYAGKTTRGPVAQLVRAGDS